jgi:hypothetical protein
MILLNRVILDRGNPDPERTGCNLRNHHRLPSLRSLHRSVRGQDSASAECLARRQMLEQLLILVFYPGSSTSPDQAVRKLAKSILLNTVPLEKSQPCL